MKYKVLADTKKYIERYLSIRTKEGKIVPFRLNEPQLRFYEVICAEEEKKKPIRIIILKSRQMGFSTLTEGTIYKKTATRKGKNALIITHKDEATSNLFNMSKLFYEKSPEWVRPMLKNSNAKELIFENPTKNPAEKKNHPGLKSKIKCTTAGGKGVGRSDTLNYIHMSEVAFWPGDILTTYAGLMQAVPNTAGSMVIIESTANGFNAFKKMWDDAVAGRTDYVPLFFAWYEMQEYRMAYHGQELTDEEKELQAAFQLDNEQLMWRRWCIANNCNNDLDMFKQEYPSTPEEAFLTNMVAGNISSAITNFIPITQGMSAMSTGSNLKGMKEAMKYMIKGGMDDITKKSAFLTTREGRQMLYRTGLQKVTDAAVTPMEVIDRFTTQSVWRSRYYENIKKGLDESRAILEADDYSRRLFAGRSKGAMPTIFHSKNPIVKPLTMFQLEVNNQLDFLLKDLPKEAHGSAIKAFQIYSGVFVGAMIYNDVYEKLTGRRAALDPIGMANRALGDFTGTKLRNTVDIAKDALTGKGFQGIETGERKKASIAAGNLVEGIGGNVPFVGGILFDGGRIPLSAADPGLGSIGGAVINAAAGDGSWGKAGSVVAKNLSNPFYYAALPFGGSQLRKTVGGLSAMAKGGSYSTTNNGERLQFPVDQSSPAKWAQAGVLGKWALPEAQGYLNGQTKAFSEKRTSTYEKLKEKEIVNMQAYGAIGQVMQAGSQEEKRSALRLAPIREEGRPIIYYDLLASDKDKEVMDTWQGMGEDDFTIYDCVEQLTDSKTDNRKRNVLINSKMSEDSKKYVYHEKVTKDDDERIYDFSQAGMNMDEFLKVKNYLYVTKDRSLPTAQKRELFVNWVLEKGYSKGQREVIYESFDIGKKYRR